MELITKKIYIYCWKELYAYLASVLFGLGCIFFKPDKKELKYYSQRKTY